jgi:hypothetical protein
MPKQPTWEDLGGTPGIAGTRPVGSYDVDAYARGAQKIANAGERFGASVARLGESEAEFAARRARQEFTAAQTQAITGLMGLRSRYAADPDYTTVKQRWTDDAAKTVDEPAGLISSEPVRLAYYDSLHEPLMQEARNFSRQAFQGAADAHAARREQLVQQLEQNLSIDPYDALSTAATDNIHSNINDAADKRFITPEQATIEKKNAALRLTVANYKKLARVDPDRAIEELTADESPHPLVQFLSPDTRQSLVTRAQDNLRAGQLDAERNKSLAAQESQRAAAQAESDYLEGIFGGAPDIADKISKDETLPQEKKDRLLATIRRTMQPEPPSAVANANAMKLLGRIRRDDGDAERIVDPTEILDAYNRGEIGKPDYDFLTRQLAEMRTPEGAALAAQKRLFMFGFKPVIDPDRPDADAIATEQTYQLEKALDQRIERMRAAGKDPRDLFDPTEPDHLRSAFDLVPRCVLQGIQGTPAPNPMPAASPPATSGSLVAEAKESSPSSTATAAPQMTAAKPTPGQPEPDMAENSTPPSPISQQLLNDPSVSEGPMIRIGGNREDLDPKDFLDFVGPVRVVRFNSLRAELREIQPKNYVLITPSLRNPGGYPTGEELGKLIIARDIPKFTEPLAVRARQLWEIWKEPFERENRTVSVLQTTTGIYVGANGPTGLSDAQRYQRKSTEDWLDDAPDAGVHAEVAALENAKGLPQYIASSRPFCPTCRPYIEGKGGVLTSPSTAYFPFNTPSPSGLRYWDTR